MRNVHKSILLCVYTKIITKRKSKDYSISCKNYVWCKPYKYHCVLPAHFGPYSVVRSLAAKTSQPICPGLIIASRIAALMTHAKPCLQPLNSKMDLNSLSWIISKGFSQPCLQLLVPEWIKTQRVASFQDISYNVGITT